MFSIGLTDHLEGARERDSAEIYREVSELVKLADELGVKYAWLAEHHGHAHFGHLPAPLMLALKLAGETRRIRIGSAIVCLNLHHPLEVAEQVAVADVLMDGRLAAGFGSGSTPEEVGLFGLKDGDEEERHARFDRSLVEICSAWASERFLPKVSGDLMGRCWCAVNSVGTARVAGKFNLNVLFSHLRTPEQYREYARVYRAAGGTRLIAANRPVFVGPDDASAFDLAEPALRILWRRFQKEGKIAADAVEPSDPKALCGHPINFIVGAANSVMAELMALQREVGFDVANIEVRWEGLSHDLVCESLSRLMGK